MHVHAGGGLAHAQSLVHGLLNPLAAMAQPGQRGAGQRIEGDAAIAALVTLQAVRLSVAHHPLGLTLRAARMLLHSALNYGRGQVQCQARAQMRHQLLPLTGRESGGLAQQLHEFARSHHRLHRPKRSATKPVEPAGSSPGEPVTTQLANCA